MTQYQRRHWPIIGWDYPGKAGTCSEVARTILDYYYLEIFSHLAAGAAVACRLSPFLAGQGVGRQYIPPAAGGAVACRLFWRGKAGGRCRLSPFPAGPWLQSGGFDTAPW